MQFPLNMTLVSQLNFYQFEEILVFDTKQLLQVSTVLF